MVFVLVVLENCYVTKQNFYIFLELSQNLSTMVKPIIVIACIITVAVFVALLAVVQKIFVRITLGPGEVQRPECLTFQDTGSVCSSGSESGDEEDDVDVDVDVDVDIEAQRQKPASGSLASSNHTDVTEENSSG